MRQNCEWKNVGNQAFQGLFVFFSVWNGTEKIVHVVTFKTNQSLRSYMWADFESLKWNWNWYIDYWDPWMKCLMLECWPGLIIAQFVKYPRSHNRWWMWTRFLRYIYFHTKFWPIFIKQLVSYYEHLWYTVHPTFQPKLNEYLKDSYSIMANKWKKVNASKLLKLFIQEFSICILAILLGEGWWFRHHILSFLQGHELNSYLCTDSFN